MRGQLLGERKKIYDVLKGKSGRLRNDDQKGGYRHQALPNRSLLLGPDLGAADSQAPVYMAARQRYAGRFFAEVEGANPYFWERLREGPVEILFVSGLYGLLLFDEPIQDYDCHLNDYIEGADPKQRVRDLWYPVLTYVLIDFVRAARRNGQAVGHIFDLLSEESYQSVFDWQRIDSLLGVHVHHRVFSPVTGGDALPYSAQILAESLPRFYEKKGLFKDGEWETVNAPSEPDPPVLFTFEYPLQSDQSAAREGSTNEVRRGILDRHPEMAMLPDAVLDDLVVAESSWQKVQDLREFAFGGLIAWFARCVERWLYLAEPRWREKYKSPGNAFGGIRVLWPFEENVRKLFRLRRKAHAPYEATKRDLKDARDLTFVVMSGLAKIKHNDILK
jgi:hypothetical protein